MCCLRESRTETHNNNTYGVMASGGNVMKIFSMKGDLVNCRLCVCVLFYLEYDDTI